jgi:hypothetical protein
MRDSRTHGIGRFWYVDMINEELVELARASARAARKWLRKRSRVRRWQTLRPGTDTPLWNALAGAVEAQLTRRGAKSRLARLLGLSRQRLHLLIVAKSAYPDAERALLLQVWLQARLLSRELLLPKSSGRSLLCHLLNDK